MTDTSDFDDFEKMIIIIYILDCATNYILNNRYKI